MIQRCMSLLLTFLLAFPTPFWSNIAAAAVSEEPDFALGEKLGASERVARDLRATINRTVFDPEALLSELDYDHEKIIRFVRENIAFEQYNGLLRGAQGTLMSQAGNSLDQAVLLANLLKDAGYDARVARGTLDVAEARLVTHQMTAPRPEAREIGDVSRGITIVKQYGLMTSLDEAQTRQVKEALERPPSIKNMSEFDSFRSTSAYVQEAFDSFATNASSELEQTVVAEARDYYWVEANFAAADSWESIHPVLPAGVTVTPQRVSTLADSVPEDLQHRIRLQMFIERSAGGKITTNPVTATWERPVANLIGAPVTFGVLPDAAGDPANFSLPPEEIASKTNFFIPILLNGPAPGAQYFDLAGNIIDPMVAGEPASGVVKEVGRAFGDAIGAIGDESQVPRLRAVWVDITLVAPGGEELQYRRTLAGTPGATATDKPDYQLANVTPLLRTNTLIVAGGRTPRGMAIDAVLAQWENAVPGIKALAQGLEDNTALSQAQSSSLAKVSGHWHGHLAMLSRFDLVEDWSEDHRTFRHEPFIAIHTAGVGDNGGGMSRVDIVHNARRTFDISGGHPKFDPRAQIAPGVWETLTEGSMLRSGERTGAIQILQAAQNQKIPLRIINPGQPLADLPVDADGLQHIKADLDRGFTVLTPKELPEGFERTAWWRVDPNTGETLGLLDDGRGVTITEYQMTLIFGIAGWAFLHYSLYGCFSQAYGAQGSDVNFQLLCCVMFNYGSMLAMTLLGAAIGLALSDLATDMIGLSADVLDFGMGFDGMFCQALLN